MFPLAWIEAKVSKVEGGLEKHAAPRASPDVPAVGLGGVSFAAIRHENGNRRTENGEPH
jgi:hypothetical protein